MNLPDLGCFARSCSFGDFPYGFKVLAGNQPPLGWLCKKSPFFGVPRFLQMPVARHIFRMFLPPGPPIFRMVLAPLLLLDLAAGRILGIFLDIVPPLLAKSPRSAGFFVAGLLLKVSSRVRMVQLSAAFAAFLSHRNNPPNEKSTPQTQKSLWLKLIHTIHSNSQRKSLIKKKKTEPGGYCPALPSQRPPLNLTEQTPARAPNAFEKSTVFWILGWV